MFLKNCVWIPLKCLFLNSNNMKRELNLGALPIARDEYLNQLVSLVQPLISKGFWSIYKDARKKCSKENRKHERFKEFQYFIKQIPVWSSLMVEEETRRIKENIDCLSELITVIFVGNVKILASIRLKGNHNNIKVKIPSCNNFIHTIYINSAKRIFYNPLIFDHKCNPIDSEKNMDQIYEYIEKAIVETIQQMLPIKNILDEYLGNVFEDEITCNDESDKEERSDDDEMEGESIYGNQIGSDSEDSEADNDVTKEIITKPKKMISFPKTAPLIQKGYLSNDNDDRSEVTDGDNDEESDNDDNVESDNDDNVESDNDDNVESDNDEEEKGIIDDIQIGSDSEEEDDKEEEDIGESREEPEKGKFDFSSFKNNEENTEEDIGERREELEKGKFDFSSFKNEEKDDLKPVRKFF